MIRKKIWSREYSIQYRHERREKWRWQHTVTIVALDLISMRSPDCTCLISKPTSTTSRQGKPCVATRHNVTSPSHLVEVEVPCFGLYKSTEHNPAIGRARSIRLPICVQTSYLPLLEFYICIIDFTGGGKVGLVNRLLDLEGHKTWIPKA